MTIYGYKFLVSLDFFCKTRECKERQKIEMEEMEKERRKQYEIGNWKEGKVDRLDKVNWEIKAYNWEREKEKVENKTIK